MSTKKWICAKGGLFLHHGGFVFDRQHVPVIWEGRTGFCDVISPSTYKSTKAQILNLQF